MSWTRFHRFRVSNPWAFSLLIFFCGVILGGVLYLIWPPLLFAYVVGLATLFALYELRKRLFRDRSGLVWFPFIVGLAIIIVWPVREHVRALALIIWVFVGVLILKWQRSRDWAAGDA